MALAARERYGEAWPAALRTFKVGPAVVDDPWQLYVRVEYCLELSGQMPPTYTLPCGAVQLAEPITLPSAGVVGPVL